MNDADASGGQAGGEVAAPPGCAGVVEESRPGVSCSFDEPFAHLDIVNIERVSAFLKATRAQYLLTTR